MRFSCRNEFLGHANGIGDVIESAHLFAYNDSYKTDVILKVLMALAETLPTEAQVALAQQLGYEPVEEPPAEPEYSWECNECGSQEYTMAVSQSDACWMGCSGCGGDEFHKEVVR